MGSASLLSCAPGSPLRLGLHPWIGYETFYLAKALGWLPEHVALMDGQTAGDSLQALVDDRVDAACLTLDEVFLARSHDLPMTVVAVLNISAGADVVMARPELAHLADLAGRRIGLEQSALGQLMLATVLDAAGLTQNQVTVLDIPPHQQMEAWSRGEADAFVSYEPTASRLEQAGAVRLFDTRQAPETVLDVLAVHDARVRRRKGQMTGLLEAHFRALGHIQVNRQDAIYRIGARQGIEAEAVRRALAGVVLPDLIHNQRYLVPGSRVSQMAAKLHQLMLDKGMLADPDDLADLFDAGYLPRELART